MATGATATSSYEPAPQQILDVFREEVAARGGSIADVYADPDRLYARAVLPHEALVRPGDAILGGVAVRTRGPEIVVHPYSLRVVCTNGAIAGRATQSRRVTRAVPGASDLAVTSVLEELRAAVCVSASPRALKAAADQMHWALEMEADAFLELLPIIDRLAAAARDSLLRSVMSRFEAAGDRSAFGLVNAVTATARDTRDPEARWQLEELGGTLLALLPVRPKSRPPAARALPLASADERADAAEASEVEVLA